MVLDTMKGDSHLFLSYPTVQQQFQMQDELGQMITIQMQAGFPASNQLLTPLR